MSEGRLSSSYIRSGGGCSGLGAGRIDLGGQVEARINHNQSDSSSPQNAATPPGLHRDVPTPPSSFVTVHHASEALALPLSKTPNGAANRGALTARDTAQARDALVPPGGRPSGDGWVRSGRGGGDCRPREGEAGIITIMWRWGRRGAGGTPANVDHRVACVKTRAMSLETRGSKNVFGLSLRRELEYVFACCRQWLHLQATPLSSMPLAAESRLLPVNPGLQLRNEPAPPKWGHGRQSAPYQYNLKGDIRARQCHPCSRAHWPPPRHLSYP